MNFFFMLLLVWPIGLPLLAILCLAAAQDNQRKMMGKGKDRE